VLRDAEPLGHLLDVVLFQLRRLACVASAPKSERAIISPARRIRSHINQGVIVSEGKTSYSNWHEWESAS
jgi:hypothetical protein